MSVGAARVWITGIGVVSPLAIGASATMDALVAGTRAMAEVTRFDASRFRARLAAEVKGFEARDVCPKGEQSRWSRWSRSDAMALVAAEEALKHAQLDPRATPVDLVVGGSTSGLFETEEVLGALHRDAARTLSQEERDALVSYPISATTDRLRDTIGPFRRARTICTACSTGAVALATAAHWLATGRADAVLAGATDALCRLTFAGFNALGAMDPSPCKPFDRRRAGLNLGEAAAFLVLERADTASARGATPIAELSGYAVGAEAHHITQPDPAGIVAARLMSRAIERAGISPDQIDYVNAHGTATPHNDRMEAEALSIALGDHAKHIAISSSKGQIGHTLAAAGAIEAAITAMAIARGVAPPTAGLEDPEVALAHVKDAAKQAPIRAALSSSFGFGGMDAVVVITRPGFAPEPPVATTRRIVITGSAVATETTIASTRELTAAPIAKAIAFDPTARLDRERARRLDPSARLATALFVDAQREAAAIDLTRTGVAIGWAFSAVDATAAFTSRITQGEVINPAAFPSLVPSSIAGHASIYLGARGPAFVAADVGRSAESATLGAIDAIECGDADAMLIAGIGVAGSIAARALEHVHPGAGKAGGAAILIEAEAVAAARGASPLALIVASSEGDRALPEAPSSARLHVVLTHPEALAIEPSAWSAAPRTIVGSASDLESLFAHALARGTSILANGDADYVLVVGAASWVLLKKP